jgi:hypothetical protein
MNRTSNHAASLSVHEILSCVVACRLSAPLVQGGISLHPYLASQRLARIGPPKRFGHGLVEIVNELQNALPNSLLWVLERSSHLLTFVYLCDELMELIVDGLVPAAASFCPLR